MIAVLSLVPVGLGLFLLAFGVPERRLLEPNLRNAILVAVLSVLVGPVALIGLGVTGWLTLITLIVAGVLLTAGLEPPRQGSAGQR